MTSLETPRWTPNGRMPPICGVPACAGSPEQGNPASENHHLGFPSHGKISIDAMGRGTRRTPLNPPFARGEKDETPPIFPPCEGGIHSPPLRRGGRGGETAAQAMHLKSALTDAKLGRMSLV